MDEFAERRAEMVQRQLRDRGIEDERVLAAMGTVPREAFVGERRRDQAYVDAALPIGSEQTISQPWIVAAILQALALAGDERVLEVGTGSGYSTALLGRLAAHVVSVERHSSLARIAAEHLRATESHNVELMVGDGSRGVPARAPFDAIAVHAAAPAAAPGPARAARRRRPPGRPGRLRVRGDADAADATWHRDRVDGALAVPLRPADRSRGLLNLPGASGRRSSKSLTRKPTGPLHI